MILDKQTFSLMLIVIQYPIIDFDKFHKFISTIYEAQKALLFDVSSLVCAAAGILAQKESNPEVLTDEGSEPSAIPLCDRGINRKI